MSILNDKQIKQKLTRLAFEIIEQNEKSSILFLAGINNNGFRFAQLLQQELLGISNCPFEVKMIQVRLNPAKPIADEITLDVAAKELRSKTVILIDDVANTGRTLFYAFRPFMDLLLKKMQVAVLVDRKHKAFPIKVDYVGLSLATTIKDNINVDLAKKSEFSVSMTE